MMTNSACLFRRLHVLFGIELECQRIHIFAMTRYPSGPWVTQAARNLAADFAHSRRSVEHRIRDRDAKVNRLLRRGLRSDGARIIPTPRGRRRRTPTPRDGSAPCVGSALTGSWSSDDDIPKRSCVSTSSTITAPVPTVGSGSRCLRPPGAPALH